MMANHNILCSSCPQAIPCLTTVNPQTRSASRTDSGQAMLDRCAGRAGFDLNQVCPMSYGPTFKPRFLIAVRYSAALAAACGGGLALAQANGARELPTLAPMIEAVSRVFYVAGFAVNAILGVDLQPEFGWLFIPRNKFIHTYKFQKSYLVDIWLYLHQSIILIGYFYRRDKSDFQGRHK